MAVLSSKGREIEAKLVYYGTALGGKTTNLLMLHRLAQPAQRQKLVSLNTAGDRTLFFDLLPFDLGKIMDWSIRLKLYTIPGQPEYNETRRVVLAGADGIVFVADSSPERAEENRRSVNFLKLNLKQNGLDADTLPMVFQYNKRDLPGALPTSALEGDLNWRRAPYFLASAIKGERVLETFEEASSELVARVLERFGTKGRAAASPQDIKAAIHESLLPLYRRRGSWSEASEPEPAADSARVVVTSMPAALGSDDPGRSLDTQDLLQSALEHEMRLLNEILDREEPDDDTAGPASRPGLDPGALLQALAAAAAARDIEGASAPFLELACREAGLESGAVLLLGSGEGALTATARLGGGPDLLNAPPALGGPPAARRIALGGVPLYGAELLRAAGLGRAAGPDAPVPAAAVPLAAMGRKIGLLVLDAKASAPALPPAERARIEATAAVLALTLAVRGLERRLEALGTQAGGRGSGVVSGLRSGGVAVAAR